MIQSIQDMIGAMTEDELGIAEYAALSNAKGIYSLWSVIPSEKGTKEGKRADSNNEQQTK